MTEWSLWKVPWSSQLIRWFRCCLVHSWRFYLVSSVRVSLTDRFSRAGELVLRMRSVWLLFLRLSSRFSLGKTGQWMLACGWEAVKDRSEERDAFSERFATGEFCPWSS